MAIWKALTTAGVRFYFKVVTSGGNLRAGLVAGDFNALVIEPGDAANQAVTINQSVQQAGVYYGDVPFAFLGAWGAGHYGISIGVHAVAPRLDDEVLYSLEVTTQDINSLVDDIWDEPIAGHLAAGTTGKTLSDAAVGGAADWTVNERSQIRDALGVNGAKIVAVAGQLQNKAEPGNAMTLTAGERTTLVNAIFANVVEGVITFEQAQRLILSVSVGKTSDFGTNTPKFRDTTDAKDRVTATLDGDGNRTAVVLDPV